MTERTKEKMNPLSPFTFRNRSNFRNYAAKLSTLADRRKFILHKQDESGFSESFVREGLNQKLSLVWKSILCTDFYTLIFTTIKVRHMLWSVMGFCVKRLK